MVKLGDEKPEKNQAEEPKASVKKAPKKRKGGETA